jgi:hypothetical protein
MQGIERVAADDLRRRNRNELCETRRNANAEVVICPGTGKQD